MRHFELNQLPTRVERDSFMKSIKNIALAIPAVVLLTGCAALSGIRAPAPEPLVITEPEVVVPQQIQSTLKDGETLWEFSERTTGSGFNWEKIALLNSIEDERKVDAGLVLVVPPELAIDELKSQ